MSRVDEILTHYGVKGMHWGVRKDNVPTSVSVKPGKTIGGKPKIKTKGGKNQPASDDAIRKAISVRKARSSSVSSLTNAELQSAVQRMNLEQQYSKLAVGERNAGVKFAAALVGSVGKQQVTRVANDTATKKVNDAMNKNKD